MRASRTRALWSAAAKRVAAQAGEWEDKSGRWNGRGPLLLNKYRVYNIKKVLICNNSMFHVHKDSVNS